jgi:hypothetical protein
VRARPSRRRKSEWTDSPKSRVERDFTELSEAVLLRDVADRRQGCCGRYGPTTDALTTMYQEVCSHHQSISDFRGKLLALVPIASGAFIGLATAKEAWTKNGPLLIAAGVVGALVTFGLYLFEAWQADTCRHLEHHASFLEEELHMEAGQFRTLRPKTRIWDVYGTRAMERREHRLKDFERLGARPEWYLPKREPRWGVGAELAGLVVYGVVIAAWLTVAGFGMAVLL